MLRKPSLSLPAVALALFCVIGSQARAMEHAPFSAEPKLVLPEFAAPSNVPNTNFSSSRQSTAWSGATADRQWSTRLSYPSWSQTALDAVYGMRLDSQLAGAARVTYGVRSKEVLLSAMYAPESDWRIEFSGGRLEQTNDFQFASGLQAEQALQHQYLVGIQKIWDDWTWLSDFSLSTWRAVASETSPGPRGWQVDDGAAATLYVDPRQLAPGAQHGYQWQIGIAPLPRTRLELAATAQRLAYDFADGSVDRHGALTHRAQYTQYLGNCAQLQGQFHRAETTRGFGVSLRHGAWRVAASSVLERQSGDREFELSAGYTIALGATRGGCDSDFKQARSFGSMVGNVVARDPNLPSAPLVQVDPTAQPVPSSVWRQELAQ